MPKDRARAKFACQIAGMDPDRFNELVAAGSYPCAPRTIPGAARIFDVNDILTLDVHRRLTERGLIPSKAARIACDMRDFLREHPQAERGLCIWDSSGRPFWMLPEHLTPGATSISGFWIVSVEEWHLGWMRARILQELNDDDRIAGLE